MQLNNIVKKPLVTEKSMYLADKDKYVFEVAMNASKGAVAEQVKKMFGVDVVEVSTMIMPGKRRRILGTFRYTKTPKWKKAVVKVKEGQKIDFFS